MPHWCIMGPICSTCVHSQIHLHCVQNLFPIGPAVWPHFPGFWIVDPLKPTRMPPWGIVGRIVFSPCPFPDESTDVYRIWCNRSIRLAAFPDLNLWPPKTPRNAPCGIEGRIVFSYVHSQTNPQTCTKFGANRSSSLTAFPDIWICHPLKSPKMPPGVLWGDLYLAYVHSQMNPQTWTKVGGRIVPAVWQLLHTFERVTFDP